MLDSEIREYCRIPEDENIRPFIDAAEAYLANAGVVKSEGNPLYVLAVKMLVSFWYDNRIPAGSTTPQGFGLEGIIAQLKYGGVTI